MAIFLPTIKAEQNEAKEPFNNENWLTVEMADLKGSEPTIVVIVQEEGGGMKEELDPSSSPSLTALATALFSLITLHCMQLYVLAIPIQGRGSSLRVGTYFIHLCLVSEYS